MDGTLQQASVGDLGNNHRLEILRVLTVGLSMSSHNMGPENVDIQHESTVRDDWGKGLYYCIYIYTYIYIVIVIHIHNI